MIKQLKKQDLLVSPFVAAKAWELFNVDPQDLVLTETTGSEEPVALEFLDYSDGTGTGSLNRNCNIALEQQSDDLAIPEEGISGSGTFLPQFEETNIKTGTFKRLVYNQTLKAFYNDYKNPLEIFGMENIDFPLSDTDRFIGNEFVMFTIPRNIFGDHIMEKSVTLYDTKFDDNLTIQDDGFGNLLAGNNLFSKVQEIRGFGNAEVPPFLNAPISLSASSGSVILNWTASGGETQFTIERSIDRGLTWNPIATVSAISSSFRDTTVTSSTSGCRYNYRVYGFNGFTSSLYSNTASIAFSSSYNRYSLVSGSVKGVGSLPAGRQNLNVYAHNGTIYLFGGVDSGAVGKNTIFTASIDTPMKVGDSGFTLPFTSSFSALQIISGTMYLFAGQFNNSIMTASVTNPLKWGDSGVKFPIYFGDGASVIIGNKIWFLHGINWQNQQPSSASFTASTDNPLNIGFAGVTNARMVQMSVVRLGDTLYQYGGALQADGVFTNAKRIYTASVSNPLVWGTASAAINIPGGSRPCVAIDNAVYDIGGYLGGTSISSEIWAISASTPVAPTDTGANMVSASHYHRALALTQSNGTPYLVIYGGGSGDTSIAETYIFTGSINVDYSLTASVNYDYPDWLTLKGTELSVRVVP